MKTRQRLLALGVSLGGAGAAFADHGGSDPEPLPTVSGVTITDDNGLTCDGAGYVKPGQMDASSGTYSDAWGSASWNGSSFTWTLKPGYDVDFCVKGSTLVAGVDTSAFTGTTYDFSAQAGHGISHTGYRIVSTPPVDPEPTPAVMNITFMCKTVEDGVVLNTEYAGDSTEWDADAYIVRIRSDQADVAFQVKVGGTVIYEGVSIAGDLFFSLDSATGGMSVHWGDGLSKGTASTNENPCDYPEVEPTVVTPAVDVSPYNCLFGGSFTLSDTDGIVWTVDGDTAEPGVYPVALAGTEVDIVAAVDPERDDIVLSDEAQTVWALAFEEPAGGCLQTFPLVEPSVAFSAPDCLDQLGTYTLSNTEGVSWVVNGEAAESGTYDAATGSTVSIEAVAQFGYGFAAETPTEWENTFVSDEECELPTLSLPEQELPTLALTGTSDLTGALGLAAVLVMLTGMGMVAARRRVEA